MDRGNDLLCHFFIFGVVIFAGTRITNQEKLVIFNDPHDKPLIFEALFGEKG
jgi:hypothetical protein